MYFGSPFGDGFEDVFGDALANIPASAFIRPSGNDEPEATPIEDVMEDWCRANPVEAVMGLPPEATIVIDPVAGAGVRVTAR